ncbi:MAG: hypothetical protein PHX39_01060 [Bacteroidales bacterium]|jgi:hypothetical protein|nr:hypothetical protein [Bacteroidales bacterium]MDD3525528.1 hypothetical protein [Bacteroidales bacterium]MDD4176217.1 hypothetical protein [Bacteroidales bacterium]MDD4740216.1 hypothetical protein [Bacteroidales bacterium]NCU36299.1 hypothetical protein [Candidatus Falkowbacteria bacterium]
MKTPKIFLMTITLVMIIIIPVNLCFAQDPWNNGIICNSDPEYSISEEVSNFSCDRSSPFWKKSNRFHFIPNGEEVFEAKLNIIV